ERGPGHAERLRELRERPGLAVESREERGLLRPELALGLGRGARDVELLPGGEPRPAHALALLHRSRASEAPHRVGGDGRRRRAKDLTERVEVVARGFFEEVEERLVEDGLVIDEAEDGEDVHAIGYAARIAHHHRHLLAAREGHEDARATPHPIAA